MNNSDKKRIISYICSGMKVEVLKIIQQDSEISLKESFDIYCKIKNDVLANTNYYEQNPDNLKIPMVESNSDMPDTRPLVEDAPEEDIQIVKTFINNHQKIDAVKHLRTVTKSSLLECKLLVDRLIEEAEQAFKALGKPLENFQNNNDNKGQGY